MCSTGKSSLTISAKPIGVGAALQRLRCDRANDLRSDAHRDDGRRFVVHADEKLRAFVELESAVQGPGFSLDKSQRGFP